jgi:menaquinone-dependent protoporphyrinogen oxidase
MEDQMDSRVLVTYATKYGSTAEIAEKIGEVLAQGFPTDVLPVNRVNNLDSYRAIVLGSAVYIGRWRKEAARFLKANEKVMAKRLVWLFSSGPTGTGDPLKLMNGWLLPKVLQPIADRVRPREVTVFNGALDAAKLSGIEKWMINKVNAPLGDARNWEAVTSWAEAIAEELKREG